MNGQKVDSPLPPLPNLSTAPAGASAGMGGGDPFSELLSGLLPVKTEVGTIMASLQKLQRLIPGSEQQIAPLVAGVIQLLPLAAQSQLSPFSGAPELTAPPTSAPPMDVMAGQGF